MSDRGLIDHLRGSRAALASLSDQLPELELWGDRLAARLGGGAKLLAAGNGGSAAEAQHLTAELVGRFSCERRPLSAMPLHADTSTLTALINDYGIESVFARQVLANGSRGDVLLLLSTSGASRNLLSAAQAARESGIECWALTGRSPNPLATIADRAVAIEVEHAPAVQEAHLTAIHLICTRIDALLGDQPRASRRSFAAENIEIKEAIT